MAASYTYIGDDERYYPEHGVHAVPASGDTPATTATFDAKPDDFWATSSSKKAAAVTQTTTTSPGA